MTAIYSSYQLPATSYQLPATSYQLPATRQEFWSAKLEGNRHHDELAVGQLNKLGWRVLTVWECALKGRQRLPEDELLQAVANWLASGKGNCDIGCYGVSEAR